MAPDRNYVKLRGHNTIKFASLFLQDQEFLVSWQQVPFTITLLPVTVNDYKKG